MLLVDELRFPNFTMDKLAETYRLSEEIINDLPPDAINEILQGIGSEKDMDMFFNSLLEQTYSTLYGTHQKKSYGSTNLAYFEKLSESAEESLRCENFAYFVSSVLKDSFDIAWFHMEWFDIVQKYNYSLVEAARGHGKSVSPETQIKMFDNTIKQAKDIVKGDLLMGPDGKKRKVKDVNYGNSKMYCISQSKGIQYNVNYIHTLTLLQQKDNNYTVVDMDIEDYLKLPSMSKRGLFGFKVAIDNDDPDFFYEIKSSYKIKSISNLLIETISDGDYVSITIDGDKRFLLEDNTVIHNSFLFSNALPAWYMYKFKPKNNTPKEQSERKIMLFSFSIAQAIDLLAVLRETIETTDILKERLYDKNNFSKMELIGKNKTNIKVKGFGGSVRGAHPSKIIVDDGLKDNVMYSAEAREKSITYFHSVIMNLLEPGGKITVVGTPFHSMDLYGDLKTKKGWHCFEYPAIFPDGRILWPERWSYKSLMDKRETQGSLIFSRELLCRPITSDSTIFPIEILNNAFLRMEEFVLVNARENYKIKFNKVVVGCDLAISSSIGADSSVFSVFGVTDDGKMYLLYMYKEKGKSYSEQIAQIGWINRMFKPDLIKIEQNAFQMIFVQETQAKGLPVSGFTTTSSKNDLRKGWPSLAILFENGRIKIPIGDEKSKSVADMVVTQFSGVAFTSNGLQNSQNSDDICSSFYLSLQAVKELEGKSFDFAFI